MQENRIKGPGYYPKRPTAYHTLEPVPNVHWWGWSITSLTKSDPAMSGCSYLYIAEFGPSFANPNNALVVRDKVLSDGPRGGIGAFCNDDISELVRQRPGCIVVWLDGSWARYDHGVRSLTQGRLS